MAQIVRVPGEVKRRAAKVLSGWKNVPQYFAEGDDLHPESILDHLQQAFTAFVPIVAGENVWPNFNEAWKHVKY